MSVKNKPKLYENTGEDLMKAASIISYVVAAVLIVFAFLFTLGAFSSNGSDTWLFIGLAGFVLGALMIVLGARFNARAHPVQQNVNVKIDLPGDVQMTSIKCQACGAPLAASDIKMVNGAPMVECHSCGTTYQLTEEPKW
jgi:hypothetical protein